MAFRTVGSAKRAGRFIAALGDMLELGQASAELHRGVGMDAANMGVDRLYLVGQFAKDLADGAVAGGLKPKAIVVCPDVERLSSLLEGELKTGDVLLVKGSRATRMERVVWHLKQAFGTG
jgi:UDP-N-acetylmuramyl pentapeptide synthase